MRQYNLSFISDQDFFNHVENTVKKYRSAIDLSAFNKNIIDAVKMSFDSKIYQRTIQEVIEIEASRQLDKSNNNLIGYFHQNIFQYIKGWSAPKKGFDVVSQTLPIFAEMKNKHNTMNSSSSQKIYMRMQSTILSNPNATCYLVEVIAKRSQNAPWTLQLDGYDLSDIRIRRVSIDQFYEIATGNPYAFRDLCQALPLAIDDVIESIGRDHLVQNTVLAELQEQGDQDLLKTIYMTSFGRYQGFDQFDWL